MGDKKGREDLRRNLAIYAGLGAAYEDSDLEKEETERKAPVDMSTGGDPEDAVFDQMNVPPSVLEQANVFDDPQMEEIELWLENLNQQVLYTLILLLLVVVLKMLTLFLQ